MGHYFNGKASEKVANVKFLIADSGESTKFFYLIIHDLNIRFVVCSEFSNSRTYVRAIFFFNLKDNKILSRMIKL